jgi:hypothetical protein
VINSEKLNALGSYWSSLVDLVQSLNNYNSQEIDVVNERELFVRMCYDWQEKVMLKIYEFLPIKIDVNKAKTIIDKDMSIILDPVDNLFSSSLDMPSITDKLGSLINEEFWDLFVFNYFLRNAIYHNRHHMVYIGTLATPSIDIMKMQVKLGRENKSVKQNELLLKAKGTSWNGFISSSLFVSKDDTTKNTFIHSTINVDKVCNLVGAIAEAYINSLNEILEQILVLSENDIKTNFQNIPKSSLVKTLSSWIDKIPRIYIRSYLINRNKT